MNDFKENEYTIGYRVQELRKDKGWNQKELADKLFVNRSQISRLENNETTNVNTAMLISIAKLFHVSTDYLLGLTPIKVPKSYDISQLGLSETAVRRIILKEIDIDVLNRLLGHEHFPKLCFLIRNYFDNTTANGIMGRNALIDFATESLKDIITTNPEQRMEIKKEVNFLNALKLSQNEADIEKIKAVFMGMLRDIKSDIADNEPTGAIMTAEVLQELFATLPNVPRSELTVDDIAEVVLTYAQAIVPLDENDSALSKYLIKKLIESVSQNNDSQA